MTSPRKRVRSIQAQRKRSHKSITADLQAKTLRRATRNGLPWATDEVARIVAGIERDETTYEMALAVRRTYYSTMTTRRMVAFAMRHSDAIWKST